MIRLFHIPRHTIYTGNYDNLLHGSIVTDFENAFAAYVGAKYAVSLHSATAGIFLAFLDEYENITIPSILPPVVANALINAGCDIEFEDKVNWVGSSYTLHEWADYKFIDSAQRVDRDQYKNEAAGNDLMLFSFYPTKPVSGQDGGMIVSNDKHAIDTIRINATNGMTQGSNSWDRKQIAIGHKLYMNSSAAELAFKNLMNLDWKKTMLAKVREAYNKSFGRENTSSHLYQIRVRDNKEFVQKAAAAGIECGIHYHALHHNVELFNSYGVCKVSLPLSDEAARTMVSIPFHEMLTPAEIQTIINFVHEHK